MAYRDKIAGKRDNPMGNPVSLLTSEPIPNTDSSPIVKFEGGQPGSGPARKTSVHEGPAYSTGYVVSQPNNKGTDVLHRPSAVGLSKKDKTLPAVENPSGTPNKPGTERL